MFKLYFLVAFLANAMSASGQLPFHTAIQAQFDIAGPPGSDSFGTTVIDLPNGNFIVTDPDFDLLDPAVSNVGAVFLCSGATGALISGITGTSASDRVGAVTVLTNGNFVISSPLWDGLAENVGAVTLCSGVTGCSGVVSAENSLTGTTLDDAVGGAGVTPLTNGNFVVKTTNWNSPVFHAGAVTWCSGTVGCAGVTVSAQNSLIGTTAGDNIGSRVSALTNGNYVAGSSSWVSSTRTNVGALRWCDGNTGCVGQLSASNSLTGSSNSDFVGIIITLDDGNYFVSTSGWGGQPSDVGAITWCNGTIGCSGEVSAQNSLVGSNQNDGVGGAGDVARLTNGNYVIKSGSWNGNRGAVTWCSGITGCTGVVSAENSLVGSTINDRVGAVTPLTNGNYVVRSSDWDGEAIDVGAITWCDGAAGCTGPVSVANSLVGSTADDNIGGITGIIGVGVTALWNGNYVVASPDWDGVAVDVGAVTWCNGDNGCTGLVSVTNSLTGSTLADRVGANGATALTNGHYVVPSIQWDGSAPNVGAVTWCNGASGCIGTVSESNSLVGSSPLDLVGGSGFGGVLARSKSKNLVAITSWAGAAPDIGAVTLCDGTGGCVGPVSSANSLTGSTGTDVIGANGVITLASGDFIVRSQSWNRSTASDAGALTWCNGANGCAGMVVSTENSLVGSSFDDQIGSNGITLLENGGYIVRSNNWNHPVGPLSNAGAITYGRRDGSSTGELTLQNSVLGRIANDVLNFTFDSVNKTIIVGRPRHNIVTIFKTEPSRFSLFDYDGDGTTDFSVFRPSGGAWYLQRSAAGFQGLQFGADGDKLTPADFDGDGKTDIAVYRPSAGQWYVLNSGSGTVSYPVFGVAEDVPAPGDYDGDGKADLAVFRPSQGTWYRQNSSNGSFFGMQFGATGDVPTVGDFDGDGRHDLGIFRPSIGDWYHIRSSNGSVFGERFGQTGDRIAPADYDGDGKTDIAIYRPSTGHWVIRNSATATYSYSVFGAPADVPVAGDYDGDGKADIGVWRPSDGTWYVKRSSNGTFLVFQWGQNGDRPTPSAYGN